METGSISSNLLPCIQVLSPVRGFVPPWFCRTPEICFSRETLNEFIRFCTTLRKPTKRRIQMIQSLRNCLIWWKNPFGSLRIFVNESNISFSAEWFINVLEVKWSQGRLSNTVWQIFLSKRNRPSPLGGLFCLKTWDLGGTVRKWGGIYGQSANLIVLYKQYCWWNGKDSREKLIECNKIILQAVSETKNKCYKPYPQFALQGASNSTILNSWVWGVDP